MVWCTYGIRANHWYKKNQCKDTLRRLSYVNDHHYLDNNTNPVNVHYYLYNNTHHPQTVLWSK